VTSLGWTAAPLADVCKVVSGATPRTSVDDYWGGDIAWVTPNDLSRDRSQFITHGERSLSQKGLEACSARIFPKGSVIYSSRAPIGYVAIADAQMTTNQGCKTAVPPEGIDSRYLYWYLVWRTPEIQSRASGTTFKEISGKAFGQTILVWPDLPQQRRIVEVLEDHISRLDAAERSLQQTRLRSKLLRDSVLRSSLSADAAHRRQWAVRPLLDVSSIANGQTPKDLSRWAQDVSGPGCIPFFKVGDMNLATGRYMSRSRLYIRVSDVDSLHVTIRPPGTVLVPKRGGAIATNKKRILRSAAAYDLNTMGLVPDQSELLPEFLWLWLEGIDLARLSDGSNVPQINARQIHDLALPVPPLEDQLSTVRELDVLLDSLQQAQDSATNVKSKSLRRALLKAAFSGRLTGGASDADRIEEMAGV
jgi:type I restriction enzyme, S subunit